MQYFLRSTCCADVTQRYLYQTASGDKDVEERPFLSQQTSLSPSPSFLWTGRVFLCLSANKVCKHGQHEQVSSATLASRFFLNINHSLMHKLIFNDASLTIIL